MQVLFTTILGVEMENPENQMCRVSTILCLHYKFNEFKK